MTRETLSRQHRWVGSKLTRTLSQINNTTAHMNHFRNAAISRRTSSFRHNLGRLAVSATTGFLLPLVLSAGFAADEATTAPVPGQRDAVRLRVAQSMVEETRPPVGAIVAYWGTTNDLANLKGWELCDGTPVSTQGSPLINMNKPNLVEHFVMGCSASQEPRSQPITGGTNRLSSRSQGNSGAVALSVAQMPSHSHPHQHKIAVIGSSGDSYLGDHPEQAIYTGGQRGGDSKYALASVPATPNAGPTSTDSTGAGGGQPHTHSLPDLPEQDIRPAFVALYYIMRVK